MKYNKKYNTYYNILETGKTVVDLGLNQLGVFTTITWNKINHIKWCARYDKDRKIYIIIGHNPITKKLILAHRMVLGLTDPKIKVDHIDCKPLNCSDENLRIATVSQNGMNRGKTKSNTSGHKNVYWNKRDNKYSVRLGINNKLLFIGYFFDKEEAINAAKEARKKYHKKFING